MRDLTGSLPEQCPLEYSKKGRTLIPVPSRLSPRSPTARSLGIFALLAARDRANRITPSNCPQLPITRTSQSQILFPNTRCYGFIKKKNHSHLSPRGYEFSSPVEGKKCLSQMYNNSRWNFQSFILEISLG